MKIKSASQKIIFILLTFAIFSCQPKMSKEEYVFFDSSIEKPNISAIIDKLQNQKQSNKSTVFGNNKLSSRVWLDNSGNFVKQYSFTKKDTKFYEFLPIISYFLPQNYQNHEIVINFDENNKILKVESFYNRIILKSPLFCNPPKKSCVSSID